MNTKRLLGLACWLIAFLVPFQPALLSTEEVSNTVGLISFLAMLVLVFAGYILVDGSSAAGKAHGGH